MCTSQLDLSDHVNKYLDWQILQYTSVSCKMQPSVKSHLITLLRLHGPSNLQNINRDKNSGLSAFRYFILFIFGEKGPGAENMKRYN